MGIAATGIDVAIIADIPAGNLQSVLGTVYGKAQYAADAVGAANYKADQANSRLDAVEGSLATVSSVAYQANSKADQLTPRVDAVEGVAADASSTAYAAQGTAGYAAGAAGFLDYHLRAIVTSLQGNGLLTGYTIPAYP